MKLILKVVEIEVRYKPDFHWLIAFQYSNHNVEGTQIRSFSPMDFENLNRSSPQQIGNLLVNYKTSNEYSFGINYYYQTEADYRLGHFTDDYDRLDFTVSKTIALEGANIKLQVVAQNIFDDDYSEYQNFHIYDERYYAKMVVDF